MKKENKYNSFVMYHDFYDVIEELSIEEKGLLLESIFNYQIGNDYITDNRIVNLTLKQLIKTFERDKEKWLEIKKKRKDAINSRWEKEKNKKEEKKNIDKPTKKQIDYAEKLGINYAKISKIELSNEIDKKLKKTNNINILT